MKGFGFALLLISLSLGTSAMCGSAHAAAFGARAPLALPGDAFDEEIASVIILQDHAVQADLGISVQQRAAMNKLADAHRAKVGAYQESVQKAKGTINEKILVQYFNQLKTGVFGLLSASQLRRLREISLQFMDFTALGDELVDNRIGISAAQQKQIRSLIRAGVDKANQIRSKAVNSAVANLRNQKPKSQAEAQSIYNEANQRAEAASKKVGPQIEAIKSHTRGKVMAVLTSKQRSAWQGLLGRPFRGG